MLISGKIARDLNFLDNHGALDVCDISAFELRLKIMRATKFIIPTEMLDTAITTSVTRRTSSVSTMIRDLTSMSPEKRVERFNLYSEYCRLPFDTIFLENEKQGLLLEPYQNNGFIVTVIQPNGRLYTLRPFIELVPNEAGLPFTIGNIFVPMAGITDSELQQVANILIVVVCEILLLLNVKNTNIVKYKPSKKESAAIPKNMQSSYEYHILDLYRESGEFTNLIEVEKFSSRITKIGTMVRSHLVRGHFKRKKNGLFWWSPFMRNRKNAEIGIVDKDYRINNKGNSHE